MKTFLIVIISTITSFSLSAQTKFSPGDINGFWVFKDQYEIKIDEHTATLQTIINKNYPQKLKNNIFYDSINHKGGNTWTANRYQWKFTDGDPNNGRWVNEGEVTFTMSADKNTFTQGSRVFSRK